MAERANVEDCLTPLDRLYRTHRNNPRVKLLIDIEELRLELVKTRMKIIGDQNNTDLVKIWGQDISVMQKTLEIARIATSPTPPNEQDWKRQIDELDTELKEAQRLAVPN